MPEQKLIVLDIDETLVYSTGQTDRLPEATPDFHIEESRPVYKRPGLDEFLQFCLDRFKVAVWSQSTIDYVNQIVDSLFTDRTQLKFVWGFDRCTFVTNPAMRQYYWVKDLRKVRRRGFRLQNVVAIDDSARKYERSYSNVIRVRKFKGDRTDDELFWLMRYLEIIEGVENVRNVEKRWWREDLTGTREE